MIVPSLLIKLLYGNGRLDMFYAFYTFFLVLTGAIYAGMFFKNWTHQSRSITAIMLPSTPVEKITLVLFYNFIILIPVFTLVFYFSNLLLYTSRYSGVPFSMNSFFEEHSLIYTLIFRIIVPFAFFNSFFLLCTIWFKKRQIVIGLSSALIILIAVKIWNFQYLKILSGGGSFFKENQFLLFPSSVQYHLHDNYLQYITSNLISNISIVVYVLITISFYMAAYFKLKEKEI